MLNKAEASAPASRLHDKLIISVIVAYGYKIGGIFIKFQRKVSFLYLLNIVKNTIIEIL